MSTYRARLRNEYDHKRPERLVVQVKLPDGRYQNYFSVTADLYAWRSKSPHSCGCLHGEILRAFPHMSDIIALHLSDATGAPMHAEANGYYWLAGALGGLGQAHHGGNSYGKPSATECLHTLARHLRVGFPEAEDLQMEALAHSITYGDQATRVWFGNYIEAQRERWQREAHTVMLKYA